MGRWAYLNELFDSLNEQLLKPDEVILLLDGQNDEPQLVPSTRCIELTVPAGLNLLIYEVNANLPKKRNLGVKLSNYNNVLFSDDDDIWLPSKARTIVDYLNHYHMVTHNFNKFGSVDVVSCSKLGGADKILSYRDLLVGDNIFGGGSSISASKYLLKLYPFDEEFSYCEDFEWWFRVLSNPNVNSYYCSQSLVSYRVHSENMTSRYYKIYTGVLNLISKHLKINLIILFSILNIFLKSTSKSVIKILKEKYVKF